MVTHYSLVIRPANSNSKKLIGCGPFMLVESKNNYVYLKSFSKYFKEHPLIDGVEFWLINSNFKKWLIVPQEKYIQLNNDGIKPIEVARSGAAYLIFNKNKQNPTDMLLINYLKLIFNVADFVSELYQASIPAAYSYFYELSKSLEPVQNKQLVTPSDVSSYTDKPLNLAVFNHPRLIQEALWFKERAAMFKLKIEIITYTFDDDFFKEKILVDADIALAMDVPVTDVELGYLDFLLNKTLLFQRFINTEQTTTIVSLTEEYRAAVSFEQKTTLINQIEDYIKRENILIYLYHPLKHYNIHTFINGVEFDSNGNIALGKLWW
ncbi:ABC transporter substrate-binding protein [Listeria innocua]|uniref:ABC transporter substrate-binding protein n=1 Tax=Listeria innocua TaxID=1642 RepID=UPI0035D6B99F